MRAVIYSRVSTSRDQSPEAQQQELITYCTARGWSISETLVDHGYSGSNDQRPGLKRLLFLMRARKADIVVVTKLDRLARSLRHLVGLLDEFSSLGVQFVSIHDQIDLSTASGRLMVHMIAAFAEFERCLIRERTILGIEHARRKGKRLGRPRTRDDRTILILRSQGLTYTEIQTHLGISRGAIYRAIKSVSKSPSMPLPKNTLKSRDKDAS